MSLAENPPVRTHMCPPCACACLPSRHRKPAYFQRADGLAAGPEGEPAP
ncbi:Uncharacterised protein [Mycobacteroides abscessus subsp. abscessus]|nr:Uncharacterised protein [Mycobacteroides abscessus subsp. abscessus]